MGLRDRIAAWLTTARLRRKARAAAQGPVAPHVASAALTYFGKHPAAAECVIGPAPAQSQLFTRKDLGRLATITKGVGDRIFARTLVGGAAYGSPGGWTSDRYEQVLHYRHWSYLAVKAIGNELAGLVPSVAHVRHGGEPGAARKSLLERRHAKSLHTIRPHEDVEHAGPSHPLVRLFERPNAWDTAGDLWFELCLFLQLTGNAYLWTVPSRLGLLTGTNQPCELWVIPAHWVFPKLGPAGIDCYEVRPFQGPGTLRFPAEEIIHLRLKNPLHKIDGYSPQVAGAETIDALESVNRSRYWQFKNGCFPVGHLELGEQYADPSEEDLERVYAKFFRRFQGEQNYGAPIITGPGSKYNPLEIAPREMAYFETAEQLRDWVLALWGVPKEILGIQPAGNDLSWYAPMQQFCRFTLQPLLRYLGQALTRHLAGRYDRSLRIWWEDPTPDNPDQLNKDLALDAANGWVTPNEARAIRGREAYPFGGEDPMLPPGLSPMPFATGEQLDMPLPPQQPPGGGGFPPGKSFPLKAWDEGKHPRADDGEFGEGGGGGQPRRRRPGGADAAHDLTADELALVQRYVSDDRALSPAERKQLGELARGKKTRRDRLERVIAVDPKWTPGETLDLTGTSFSGVRLTEGKSAGAVRFKWSDEALAVVEKPTRGLDVPYGAVRAPFDAATEKETIVGGAYRVKEVRLIPTPGTPENYGRKSKLYVLEEVGGAPPAGKALKAARTKAAEPAADFPHVLQSEAWDCGAACLRAVAEHYGVLPPPPDREEAFIRLLGTNPEDGTRPGRIVEGARRLGLDAQAKGGMSVEDLAAETAAGRVVICCTQQTGAGWDQGHYVTAIAVSGKSVLVQDPVDGRKRVGRGLWLKRWHDADADGQRYERFGIVIGKPAERAQAG